MQSALVIGSASATIKHRSIEGRKLLVVQPLMADNVKPDGFPLIAIDAVGAGVGEKVIITSDGRSARELLKVDLTPVRYTAIGIVDA